MSDDLAGQIGRLSDKAAMAALAFVLNLEDASTQDVDRLQEAENRLPEAFANTPDLDEFTAAGQDETAGDLARATLIYLTGQEPTRLLVVKALESPRHPGQRDPVTLAVGGLVLLALKSDIELKRTTSGKWSFHYRLKPTKDTALGGIVTKLWGLAHGGHAGG
jgi:hypothetical protein